MMVSLWTTLAALAIVVFTGVVLIKRAYEKGFEDADCNKDDIYEAYRKVGFRDGYKVGYVEGHKKGLDTAPAGCLDLRPTIDALQKIGKTFKTEVSDGER